MSYSDYGAYVWSRQPGNDWERRQDREDATLSGISAPADRPLEEATGMKLDVLLNAANQAKIDHTGDWGELDNYLLHHPAHAILGGLKDIAIRCHKHWCHVMRDGKQVIKIDYFSWALNDDYKGEYAIKTRQEIKIGTSQNIPASGNIGGAHYSVRNYYIASYLDKHGWQNDIEATLTYLQESNGTEWLAMHGYGIGEHWWQDSEGYRLNYDLDGDYDILIHGRETEDWHYPQPDEAFAVLLGWHTKELT